MAIWRGILVAAFGNGQLAVYDLGSGRLGATVNAHARWINAIDVATDSGLVMFYLNLVCGFYIVNFILPKFNTDYIRQVQVTNTDNFRLIRFLHFTTSNIE